MEVRPHLLLTWQKLGLPISIVNIAAIILHINFDEI